MKICIFTDSIDKKDGGPSRSVPILVKGLAEIGCEVTLMTQESDDMNTHIIDGSRAKIVVFKKGVSRKKLESLLIEGKYDIIHSQGIWLPIYHKMSVIARRHNIPYLTTPRGDLEPWSLKQKTLKKKIALMLYQRNDINKAKCILATADMERDHLRNLGFVNPIAVIPNGIDIAEYKCRDFFSKGQVKKQIVFLSRLHPKKGIEILIDAWKILSDQYPDWNIVVAGNGDPDYLESLKIRIREQGLESAIKIIPPIFGEDKYRLYCESSLFVLPTFSENFGMVIAEALSCGVPVITTTGTPWHELNENGIGWCVELSVKNIADTLKKAISLGEDKLFEMGHKGSSHVRNKYSYLSVAKMNLALYEYILSGTNKPSYLQIL